jgi:hypothetical protein
MHDAANEGKSRLPAAPASTNPRYRDHLRALGYIE